jgi:hypothetical protein
MALRRRVTAGCAAALVTQAAGGADGSGWLAAAHCHTRMRAVKGLAVKRRFENSSPDGELFAKTPVNLRPSQTANLRPSQTANLRPSQTAARG